MSPGVTPRVCSQKLGNSTFTEDGVVSQSTIASIGAKLLDWYAEAKRDLPWRRHSDPYAVWVSEIMLQQTTVAAVIPFYERWMLRFPSVAALADSPIDDVLKLWSGLGYYARARNLHKAANEVVSSHESRVPNTFDELVKLPGVGRYTAGAILSIAYQQDVPILDANVTRILCRLFEIAGDPKQNASTQTTLWCYAAKLIPRGQARVFNQSMMELGATICSPKNPQCVSCPVAEHCSSHRHSKQSLFPEFGARKPWATSNHVSIAILDQYARVLIIRRNETDPLWGGLWELPRVALIDNEDVLSGAVRAAALYLGDDVGPLIQFGHLKHVVGNCKIDLRGYRSNVKASETIVDPSNTFEWVRMDGIGNYAMASPQVRLIEQLRASISQEGFDYA